MKKTQLKDGLRNIRKQKVSFLSIVIIAMLGVTTFLGIDYTATGMRRNGSSLYEKLNYRDVEVVSTLLLTDEDLDSLRGVAGVTDAEPVRYANAKLSFGEALEDVDVVTLTQRINRVDLRQGRLPAAEGECAVEPSAVETLGLSVGDRIQVTESGTSFLKNGDFVITGIVAHPDHINSVATKVSYVMVTYDAFNDETLNGCFMRAETVFDKPAGINRFSEKYDKLTTAVLEGIEEIAPACVKRRQESLQKQLQDGFAQLETAKAAVRDKVRIPFEETFPADKISGLISWATVREADVEDPNETARYFWITENTRVDLSHSLEDFFGSIVRSESVPKELLVALYQATQHEDAPKTGTEYDYDAIREALVNAAAQAGDGYRQLSDGCALWDAGHAQYISVTRDGGRWLSFGGKGNASFVQLAVASGNFAKLKATFSLMFVLVGALVIFATVGKMVDEQRNQIGTTKALGFFNREIFAKYLGFGMSATAIGTVIGILAARFALEPFMLNGFNKYYWFDLSESSLVLSSTLIVSGAGLLLSAAAVWLACTKLLRQPAVVLMLPKTPSAKKKKAAGKRVLPLYSRLILMNIRADLKRVIVTVVSVTGCCALVVIGLTLRASVKGSITRQYGEIVDYDVCVHYDPAASENTSSDVQTVLQKSGTEFTAVYSTNAVFQIDDLQSAELFCGDIKEISAFQRLNDRNTGDPIKPTNRGVLLQRRFAETYGLDEGSTFDLTLNGTKTATVRVAGVFENFIGRSIVMSNEYFETVFGETPVPNAFLVRLSNADADRLQKDLQAVNGYENIARADSDRSIIETSTSMIDIVVMLFIFMAAVMAGVVQLNLTNMYVSQKKRELTIMRINGFTVREVVGYVLRETVVTTAAGIVLGVGVGAGVAYRIIRTLEQPFLQFDRRVSIVAWIAGVVITILFTTIVNAICLRKVKRLKLTDMA